jgi:NADPH-dependent F420 reductase
MNIGLLGAGNVGGTLGSRWAQAGHEVIFASRNPESEEMKSLLAKAGGHAHVKSVPAMAAASDVIVLATPWNATRRAVESAGDLTGKIVIDATNPLLPDMSGMEVGTTSSGAEQVAEWAPGARVVKAFNTVGAGIMADPRFGDQKALLFYCGDDASAKRTTYELATELGFDAQDAGGLRQARLLEPLALLWISLFLGSGQKPFAFQLVKR